MIVIERITPQSALVFRDVRLRALLDAPTAFGSTYAKESLLSDEEWMKRAVRWSSDGSAMFLVFEGEIACGIIGSFEEDDPQRMNALHDATHQFLYDCGIGCHFDSHPPTGCRPLGNEGTQTA